jgi:ATP-dependent Clp protease adapter protein ClpS
MDAAHAALIGVMRSPPAGQVVIAAVHAEGKGVAVVFADGLSDPGAAIEQVGALARAAGEALGRLLRERRGEARKGSK